MIGKATGSGINGFGRVEKVVICEEAVGVTRGSCELTDTAWAGRAHSLRVEAGFLEELLVEQIVGDTMGLRCGGDQGVIGPAKVFDLVVVVSGLI